MHPGFNHPLGPTALALLDGGAGGTCIVHFFPKGAALLVAWSLGFYAPRLGAEVSNPPCGGPVVQRKEVVPCALRASLSVRAEELQREVLEGRKEAVSPYLPSNPVVALSAGHRSLPGAPPGSPGPAFNRAVTLSQELEVAGQRGLRRKTVDHELEAQGLRVLLQRRKVAALALETYFEAVAAHREVQLAETMERWSGSVAQVAKAMAEQGLVSGVEADSADATYVGVVQVRFAAERHRARMRAVLSTLLGMDASQPSVDVQGDLSPLEGVAQQAARVLRDAPDGRPELRALESERKGAEAQSQAYARARIPNLTLSFTAQNDGFDERVLGVGLALPIPLPSPLGRTYAGEIAEAQAKARRTQVESERLRRSLRLDVRTALETLDSLQRELSTFTPERVRAAEDGLSRIAREVQGARLPLREALVAQQAFTTLLRSHLASLKAVALASVDVAVAAGLPLEEGVP